MDQNNENIAMFARFFMEIQNVLRCYDAEWFDSFNPISRPFPTLSNSVMFERHGSKPSRSLKGCEDFHYQNQTCEPWKTYNHSGIAENPRRSIPKNTNRLQSYLESKHYNV